MKDCKLDAYDHDSGCCALIILSEVSPSLNGTHSLILMLPEGLLYGLKKE